MVMITQLQGFHELGKTPICPYCNKPSVKVTGKVIYPFRKDLFSKKFYHCSPCDAYVGCHPGTEMPLGRLANAELRQAKMRAHAAFDPYWLTQEMTRSNAYRLLANNLNIPTNECHIGMFDVETCEEVILICTSGLK